MELNRKKELRFADEKVREAFSREGFTEEEIRRLGEMPLLRSKVSPGIGYTMRSGKVQKVELR